MKKRRGNKHVKDTFVNINRANAIFICPQCTHANHKDCGNSNKRRTNMICECRDESHKDH